MIYINRLLKSSDLAVFFALLQGVDNKRFLAGVWFADGFMNRIGIVTFRTHWLNHLLMRQLVDVNIVLMMICEGPSCFDGFLLIKEGAASPRTIRTGLIRSFPKS
ncbi:MAG: hypothetical protein LPH21_13805 [Shewanella sp.]|nr:hypothetical protein [Shewanella sp.]MCF1458583.1 hypothetical protein [Shewanella sp.]